MATARPIQSPLLENRSDAIARKRALCAIAHLRSVPVGHRDMQRVCLRYALRLRREIRAYALTLEHKQILSAVPH